MIVVYFIVGGCLGFLFGVIWELGTVRIGHWACQGGFHFHHSLFGPLMLVLIPWVWDSPRQLFFLLGAAVGVVLQHTLKEGFIFITREGLITRAE